MLKGGISIKKVLIGAVLVFAAMSLLCSCGEKKTEQYAYASATDILEAGDELTVELLKTEEDVQYYAYLDMDEAEDELKPVIQAARNIIIHRQSWVSEGEASILSPEGELREEVPHFYDLFPEDWEVPIVD